MATIAADAEKAVLETAALEVLLELLLDIRRQAPALGRQVRFERGVIFLNELRKEGALRAMAFVDRPTSARPGFPASR
jgi:hypothetical protein